MNALMKIETLPCHKLRNPIGENIPIYRMQLGFSIGNKTKNKTKGSIFVLFNAGDKPFYLERKISELEIGQTYYFDFLSYKVKEIKDIQFLKLAMTGNGSICFSKIELLINGIRKPIFSKIYGANGHCIDIDSGINRNELIVTGPELRLSANWKELIISNKIWLPIKSISKEMIVSLVESAVGNQLHYMSGFSRNTNGMIDTFRSPAIEVKFVNSKTLHFELDLQKRFTIGGGTNDVHFDLQFACKEGIIRTTLNNLVINNKFETDIQELIRARIPVLIEELFGKMPSKGMEEGHHMSGLVSDWLAYVINISTDEMDLPQSCNLINVTSDCEVLVH